MIRNHVRQRMIKMIAQLREEGRDNDISIEGQRAIGQLWEDLEGLESSTVLQARVSFMPKDAHDILPRFIIDVINMSADIEAEWDKRYLEISR